MASKKFKRVVIISSLLVGLIYVLFHTQQQQSFVNYKLPGTTTTAAAAVGTTTDTTTTGKSGTDNAMGMHLDDLISDDGTYDKEHIGDSSKELVDSSAVSGLSSYEDMEEAGSNSMSNGLQQQHKQEEKEEIDNLGKGTATKGIATKSTATKGTATKGTTTKGAATKGAATKGAATTAKTTTAKTTTAKTTTAKTTTAKTTTAKTTTAKATETEEIAKVGAVTPLEETTDKDTDSQHKEGSLNHESSSGKKDEENTSLNSQVVSDKEQKPFDAAKKYKEILASAPVVIFSKTKCHFSTSVKDLLMGPVSPQFNISPAPVVVELDQLDFEEGYPKGTNTGKILQEYIAEQTFRKTVPNIIINGVSMGGFDEIKEMLDNKTLLGFLEEQCGDKCVVEAA